VTATDEDIDLSWATFTDEQPGEPCVGPSHEPCPLEPVAVAIWVKWCGCRAAPTRHCAGHRDVLLTCEWEFSCSACDAPAFLLRMEPAR
jgi:hypothetical protein